MSRPRGEIRAAITAAAAALYAEQGGATWPELAQRACVGFRLGRATVANMRRAGELVVVGDQQSPSRRRMAVFAPAEAVGAGQGQSQGMAAVQAALQAWGARPRVVPAHK